VTVAVPVAMFRRLVAMTPAARGLLLPLATLNVAAAFLVQLVVLARIGPGSATDAFMAAATLPQMLAGMAAAVLASAVLPMLAGEPKERQGSDGWFLLLAVGAAFLAVALLLSLSAATWSRWLFPGFSTAAGHLAADLARIQIFSMVFAAMHAVLVAVCYARGQFVRVEAVGLIVVGGAAAILFFALPVYGIAAAAWAVTLTALGQMLALLPVLGLPRRAGAGAVHAAEAWQRIRPLLLGNVYHKSDVVVDRYLLSMAAAGDMTLFALAQQFHGAVAGLFGKVWGNTAIPGLVVCAKRGDRAGFGALYRRRLATLALLAGGSLLLLWVAGEPVLALLFGHGKVAAEDVATLWRLMMYAGGVLVFGCVGVLVAGAYYALGDTRTPTYLSMATFTLFIVVKYFAFQSFGASGVAVAASGYFAVNALLLAAALPAKARRAVWARSA
jgi:peptidoglycan biosynthesis protein MviN/MurJ (putative lipid II flippase)